MKLLLWSIGKATEPLFQKSVEEFSKRLGNYYPVEWKIIPPPKNAGLMSESELKKKRG